MDEQPSQGRGLFDSLSVLVANLVAIVRTRIDLVSTELEEAQARQVALMVAVAAGIFCAGMVLVLAVVLVLALFWDDHRFAALGALIALFAVSGLVAAVSARHQIQTKPKMFSATLAELTKDYHQLTHRS